MSTIPFTSNWLCSLGTIVSGQIACSHYPREVKCVSRVDELVNKLAILCVTLLFVTIFSARCYWSISRVKLTRSALLLLLSLASSLFSRLNLDLPISLLLWTFRVNFFTRQYSWSIPCLPRCHLSYISHLITEITLFRNELCGAPYTSCFSGHLLRHCSHMSSILE
jgi:hypothetical protein